MAEEEGALGGADAGGLVVIEDDAGVEGGGFFEAEFEDVATGDAADGEFAVDLFEQGVDLQELEGGFEAGAVEGGLGGAGEAAADVAGLQMAQAGDVDGFDFAFDDLDLDDAAAEGLAVEDEGAGSDVAVVEVELGDGGAEADEVGEGGVFELGVGGGRG